MDPIEAAKPVGHVASEQGLMVTRNDAAGKPVTTQLDKGAEVFRTDVLTTPPTAGTFGSVKMNDGFNVSIGPDSRMDMSKFSNPDNSRMDIPKMQPRTIAESISGKIVKASPEPVRFSAPGMILGVRG